MSSGTSIVPRAVLQHGLEQGCWQERLQGWNKGGCKGHPKGGSRGSFNDFKGVGKDDNSKGGSKADGQGTGGKGSGFDEYCHWCEECGATLNRVVVRRTTTWRTSGRTGRATLRVVTSSRNVEENKNQLDNLENLGAIAACAPCNTVAVAVLLELVRCIAMTQ